MKSIKLSRQPVGPVNSFEYKSSTQIKTILELQEFACSLWTRVASGPPSYLYVGLKASVSHGG